MLVSGRALGDREGVGIDMGSLGNTGVAGPGAYVYRRKAGAGKGQGREGPAPRSGSHVAHLSWGGQNIPQHW